MMTSSSSSFTPFTSQEHILLDETDYLTELVAEGIGPLGSVFKDDYLVTRKLLKRLGHCLARLVHDDLL